MLKTIIFCDVTPHNTTITYITTNFLQCFHFVLYKCHEILIDTIDDISKIFWPESHSYFPIVKEMKKDWQCHKCMESKYVNMIECDQCSNWFDW